MKPTLKILAISVALSLGACATVPSGPPPEVVRLQNNLDRLHQDPRIAPNAPNELRDADMAVNVLISDGRHLDPRDYEHSVYIADRLIQTAEAEGLARFAEVHARDLGAERDRLIASSKSRQLRDTQIAADNAIAAAEAEHRNAEIARSDARASRSEVESLRADLADLQAQQTARGMVVTLGDVLFEVDRSELKPGAARTLDGLVRALQDDPRARIEIEGHTDSSGNREHNLDLSLRRAVAVQNYLIGRGVDPSRVTAQGLGPDFPVASNATEAGRLQNRRVEVIVQTRVAER